MRASILPAETAHRSQGNIGRKYTLKSLKEISASPSLRSTPTAIRRTSEAISQSIYSIFATITTENYLPCQPISVTHTPSLESTPSHFSAHPAKPDSGGLR